MAIRDLVILPDKQLRKSSKAVTKFDASLHQLLDDMLETMYDAPGIGLAAVQIGVMQRVITIDLAKEEDEPKDPQFFINPKITWESDELAVYEEGCLSIPDFYEEVERPEKCRLSFQDRDGKNQEMEADGLLATCIQHEVDHLNGVLFIDHISKLKKDRVIKKFTKAARLKTEGVS